MKKTILFISLSLLLISTIILIRPLSISAAEKAVNVNINAISDTIAKLIDEKSPLAYSSNPYDYVKNNEPFDNIVAIGADALPVIKKKIVDSSRNGLREYILAIAAERIAMVDLKGDNFGWSNAKGWVKKWDEHLRNLPDNFKKIIESNESSEEKNLQVIKMGIPALPFILDEIEKGNTTLIPALQKLVENDKTNGFDINAIKDYKEWAKANKNNYQGLIDLVNSAQ